MKVRMAAYDTAERPGSYRRQAGVAWRSPGPDRLGAVITRLPRREFCDRAWRATASAWAASLAACNGGSPSSPTAAPPQVPAPAALPRYTTSFASGLLTVRL
jgi:hypothetical protein